MNDDTISREAALAEVVYLCEDCPVEFYMGPCPSQQCDVRIMREALENLPPAQPGWIPCSVTSPKNSGNYYVTQFRYDVYDTDMTGAYICETDYIWYSTLRKKWFPKGNCKVVAWMPLPPKWEGGQDDD